MFKLLKALDYAMVLFLGFTLITTYSPSVNIENYITRDFVREVQTNESIEDVIRRLEEKYYLRIVVNPSQEEAKKYYKNLIVENTEIYEEAILTALIETEKALDEYNPEVVSEMPKYWIYMADTKDSSLIKEGKDGKYLGLCANSKYGPLAIVIAVNEIGTNIDKMAYTIHHELFHAIQDTVLKDETFEEYFAINLGCETVSNYACTNETEELAEAWSKGNYTEKYKNNEKVRYIRDKYRWLLKDAQ